MGEWGWGGGGREPWGGGGGCLGAGICVAGREGFLTAIRTLAGSV